ncbi:MAG: SAF domain-containing protein [Cyanobacteria bacterium SZAS-4]|nr:SAF domain-containing protein [Cyanobacteria bacterium SZAS-4]
MVEKVSAFFVGNVVGLTILVGGVLLTAPRKLKESEAIQKQQAELKEKAAQAAKEEAAINASASASASASAPAPAPASAPAPAPAAVETTATAKEPFASKDSAGSAKSLAPFVVSKIHIARGEKIEPASVKLEKSPTVAKQGALSDVSTVVGKTTIQDIEAGDAITAKMLKN